MLEFAAWRARPDIGRELHISRKLQWPDGSRPLRRSVAIPAIAIARR
jgi:hypothetical protein